MHPLRNPWALLLLGAVLVMPCAPGRSADHRDSPATSVDLGADIADVYFFRNASNGNVVLAMTVNGFTVPGVLASFSPDVLYQFKIDNTGDFREDLVIQATFTKAGADQRVTLVGPTKPFPSSVGSTTQLITGRVPRIEGAADGTVLTGAQGARAFAGRRDDPFFFDLTYVFRLLGFLPGGTLSRPAGIDFFARMNVCTLAVEVPASVLRGRTGNTVRMWATTSRAKATLRSSSRDPRERPPFVQLDRMGLPVINTVLVKKERKEDFNRSSPVDDRRFRADAAAILTSLNGDATYSAGLAEALLPDVLTLDVTSSAGFAALNGRRPEDDVINTVLSLATKGAIPSDGVDANDSAFLSDFPFFAPPHTPDEVIPARAGQGDSPG
jgi:hypothetical protein